MGGLAKVLLILAVVLGIVFCCLLIFIPQVIIHAIIPQLPFLQGHAEQWAQGNYMDAGGASDHGTSPYSGGSSHIHRTGYVGPDGDPTGRSPLAGDMPLNCGFHDPEYLSHTGVDFEVGVGHQVLATMGGQVIFAHYNTAGYGNLVAIENGPYVILFGHLHEFDVKEGDIVTPGQLVGLSGGATDDPGHGNSSGPHLHYEIDKYPQTGDWGTPVNPEDFLPGGSWHKVPCY